MFASFPFFVDLLFALAFFYFKNLLIYNPSVVVLHCNMLM